MHDKQQTLHRTATVLVCCMCMLICQQMQYRRYHQTDRHTVAQELTHFKNGHQTVLVHKAAMHSKWCRAQNAAVSSHCPQQPMYDVLTSTVF
jgi:hypothetical protein